jgi:hypothetical protein
MKASFCATNIASMTRLPPSSAPAPSIRSTPRPSGTRARRCSMRTAISIDPTRFWSLRFRMVSAMRRRTWWRVLSPISGMATPIEVCTFWMLRSAPYRPMPNYDCSAAATAWTRMTVPEHCRTFVRPRRRARTTLSPSHPPQSRNCVLATSRVRARASSARCSSIPISRCFRRCSGIEPNSRPTGGRPSPRFRARSRAHRAT